MGLCTVPPVIQAGTLIRSQGFRGCSSGRYRGKGLATRHLLSCGEQWHLGAGREGMALTP